MKIAITGCNGKVGQRVALLALKQGHSVRGIDNAVVDRSGGDHEFINTHEHFAFIKADLRKYDDVLKALEGCIGVVHLAGLPNPTDGVAATHNSNVVISWNVLRSAAELQITRIALASSVNAIGVVYNKNRQFDYLPLDEEHPCRPDEPYGLSKQILEMQADAIVRHYPSMRIASLRLSWAVPSRSITMGRDRANDLWGYVQEDSAAEAFLLALSDDGQRWSGHERFFIAAPRMASDEDFETLRRRSYEDVPAKEGTWTSCFDCAKAERLLGWVHKE